MCVGIPPRHLLAVPFATRVVLGERFPFHSPLNMESPGELSPLLRVDFTSGSQGRLERSESMGLGRTYQFTPESKMVETWDVSDVCSWLQSHENLEWLREAEHGSLVRRLLRECRVQDIDGVTLLRLTDADLKELGLTKIGDRKRLLHAIETLHNIKWSTVLIETLIPSGSVAGATFNLCSAVMGAGALSLPYAFAKAGVALTMFLLLLSAYATIYTIRLLIYVFEHSNTRTFEDSIEGIAGRKVGVLVEVLSILFCFGCAVAYVIVMGDALQSILGWLSLDLDVNALTVFFAAVCFLPPSCYKHIDSLRICSFIGLLAMGYVVLTTWQNSYQHKTWAPGVSMLKLDWRTAAAMPIVLFAYSCQVNVWPIYDELRAGDDIQKRRDMMMRASYASIVICVLVYSLIGWYGYRSFGSATEGNIILNFSPDTAPYASLCMLVSVFAAFPMNFYPMRQAINQLVHKDDRSQLEFKRGRVYPVLKDNTAHFLQTFVLVALIVALGILVPHVNVVFQLIGSLVSSTLCFILPAYLSILVEGKGQTSVCRTLIGNVGPLALIVFGVFVAVLGTLVTILY